jgi:hypothetical protein
MLERKPLVDVDDGKIVLEFFEVLFAGEQFDLFELKRNIPPNFLEHQLCLVAKMAVILRI